MRRQTKFSSAAQYGWIIDGGEFVQLPPADAPGIFSHGRYIAYRFPEEVAALGFDLEEIKNQEFDDIDVDIQEVRQLGLNQGWARVTSSSDSVDIELTAAVSPSVVAKVKELCRDTIKAEKYLICDVDGSNSTANGKLQLGYIMQRLERYAAAAVALKAPMWTSDEAASVVRQLTPVITTHGYQAPVIVGGVAVKGQSDHDLDLLMPPTAEAEAADAYDFEALEGDLEHLGWSYFDHDDDRGLVTFQDGRGRILDLFLSNDYQQVEASLQTLAATGSFFNEGIPAEGSWITADGEVIKLPFRTTHWDYAHKIFPETGDPAQKAFDQGWVRVIDQGPLYFHMSSNVAPSAMSVTKQLIADAVAAERKVNIETDMQGRLDYHEIYPWDKVSYGRVMRILNRIQGSKIAGLTDTDAFKAWFSGSKVVDEAGQPLVVYHGTPSDFTVFEAGDLGMHFGTYQQANNRIMDAGPDDPGLRILPVYLSLQNPLRMYDVNDWDVVLDVLVGLKAAGIELPNGWVANRVKVKEQIVNGELTDLAAFDAIRAGLNSLGYDGVVYRNATEGAGDSYIAFYPNQIKSAIGNSGAFDPDNPDITASLKALAARYNEYGDLDVEGWWIDPDGQSHDVYHREDSKQGKTHVRWATDNVFTGEYPDVFVPNYEVNKAEIFSKMFAMGYIRVSYLQPTFGIQCTSAASEAAKNKVSEMARQALSEGAEIYLDLDGSGLRAHKATNPMELGALLRQLRGFQLEQAAALHALAAAQDSGASGWIDPAGEFHDVPAQGHELYALKVLRQLPEYAERFKSGELDEATGDDIYALMYNQGWVRVTGRITGHMLDLSFITVGLSAAQAIIKLLTYEFKAGSKLGVDFGHRDYVDVRAEDRPAFRKLLRRVRQIGGLAVDAALKQVADITLPLKKGDEILTGHWLNHKEKVKSIGTDSKGQPTVNGKPILRVRLPKLMSKIAAKPSVFLGGEVQTDWRASVIDELSDSLKLIDPVDPEWTPESNIYTELADMATADEVVFLDGGDGTKKEKKFLDAIDKPYEEFDDVEELTEHLEALAGISDDKFWISPTGEVLYFDGSQEHGVYADWHQLLGEDAPPPGDDITKYRDVVTRMLDAGWVRGGHERQYLYFECSRQVAPAARAKALELADDALAAEQGVYLDFWGRGTYTADNVSELGAIKRVLNGVQEAVTASAAHSKGCLMLPVPVELSNYLLKEVVAEQVDPADLYHEEGTAFGVETSSHVTLLYGLDKDADVDAVRQVVGGAFDKPLTLKTQEAVEYFDHDDKTVAVVKIDSPQLHKLREAVEHLAPEQDYPNYVPHLTLCYLNPGARLKDPKIKAFEWTVDEVLFSEAAGTIHTWGIDGHELSDELAELIKQESLLMAASDFKYRLQIFDGGRVKITKTPENKIPKERAFSYKDTLDDVKEALRSYGTSERQIQKILKENGFDDDTAGKQKNKIKPDILSLINGVADKVDGASGNCGVFAVALNKALGGVGTYLALVEEYEPEYLSHVVLQYAGKLYDATGEVTKKSIKEQYGDNPDHPDQKLHFTTVNESTAIHNTEPTTTVEVIAELLSDLLSDKQEIRATLVKVKD